MLKKDPDDDLRNRRFLAALAVIYSFVFPLIVFAAVRLIETPADVAKAAFVYVAGLAGGPIAAYLYAAQKNEKNDP